MDERNEWGERGAIRPPVEGVRIIRPEEAREALETGRAVGRGGSRRPSWADDSAGDLSHGARPAGSARPYAVQDEADPDDETRPGLRFDDGIGSNPSREGSELDRTADHLAQSADRRADGDGADPASERGGDSDDPTWSPGGDGWDSESADWDDDGVYPRPDDPDPEADTNYLEASSVQEALAAHDVPASDASPHDAQETGGPAHDAPTTVFVPHTASPVSGVSFAGAELAGAQQDGPARDDTTTGLGPNHPTYEPDAPSGSEPDPTADARPAPEPEQPDPEERLDVTGPGGQLEMQPWTEPPTGEVPNIVRGSALEDDDHDGTRPQPGVGWQEDDPAWAELVEDGARLGALDTSRDDDLDDPYSFDEPLGEPEPLGQPEHAEPESLGRPQPLAEPDSRGRSEPLGQPEDEPTTVQAVPPADHPLDDPSGEETGQPWDQSAGDPVDEGTGQPWHPGAGQPWDEEAELAQAALAEPKAPSYRAARGRPRRPSRQRRPPRQRRPRPARDAAGTEASRNLAAAASVGIGFLVILGVCYAIGPLALLVFTALLVLACAAEAYSLLNRAGFRPAILLGLVACVAVVLAAYWKGPSAMALVGFLLFAFSLLWYLFRVVEARPLINVAVTVVTFVWVGVLASFGGLLLRAHDGGGLFLGAVVVTIVADMLAYFVGRRFGSHHLAPSTSPGKTWEGVIAGGVAALIAGAIIGHYLAPWGGLRHGLLLGLVAAVVAPIGDLAQSMIKRDLGVKDSGTILPGHGGLFDRFDSLLLVLPSAYYLALCFKLV